MHIRRQFLITLIHVCAMSLAYAADPCGTCNVQVQPQPVACISNKHTTNDPDITHSFLKPRAITSNNVFHHNLGLYWWYHDVLCETDEFWWMLEVTAFYQRSTDARGLAQYLFPCNKCALSIKENGTGDVGSVWLNLVAPIGESFSSYITMRPTRSVTGAYFDFRFDFSHIIKNIWFDASFTVMHVNHDLHFCETPSSAPGTLCDITTAAQALDQASLHFGKFSPCSLTARGIDTVQLKLGYDWFFCDTNHISPYIVGTVVVGKGSPPEYIFEPIIHVTHPSVGIGAIADYKIIDADERELTLLSDLKYRYEFSAVEERSFDLCCNGPWSRYLKAVQPADPCCSFPAINILTQNVKITPRSTVDWWNALHYRQGPYHLELGYDFWWRQQELISLSCFPQGFGMYNLAGDCTVPPVVTASTATICQSTVGNEPQADSTFVELTAQDLSLNSGALPRAFSNTLYIAGAYDGTVGATPVYIGGGASYERAHGSFSNYALWVRAGAAF